ncbi:MAG: hypothetical protein IPH35_22730 [Rhodoferax sp.]|nr:hypothetical protein [Rhodoferax sp.]
MSEQSVCPRCACDFTLALGAQAAARRHLGSALHALAQGEQTSARQSLLKSQSLQRSTLGNYLERLIIPADSATDF